MMTVLTATRWNAFLDCACLTKSCGLLPHNPPWESFFFSASSHNHDHHVDCSPIIHHGRASSLAHLHIFMITIWMARFSHMMSSRWFLLNLHFFYFSFILLMSWRYTWEHTQTSSWRHTWHWLNLLSWPNLGSLLASLYLFLPWNHRGGPHGIFH
jgi:hypothetical protein